MFEQHTAANNTLARVVLELGAGCMSDRVSFLWFALREKSMLLFGCMDFSASVAGKLLDGFGRRTTSPAEWGAVLWWLVSVSNIENVSQLLLLALMYAYFYMQFEQNIF